MSSIVQRNALRSRRNHRLRLMAGRAPMIPVVREPQPVASLVAALNRPRRLILPIIQFSDSEMGS